jgi:hypothetical protein
LLLLALIAMTWLLQDVPERATPVVLSWACVGLCHELQDPIEATWDNFDLNESQSVALVPGSHPKAAHAFIDAGFKEREFANLVQKKHVAMLDVNKRRTQCMHQLVVSWNNAASLPVFGWIVVGCTLAIDVKCRRTKKRSQDDDSNRNWIPETEEDDSALCCFKVHLRVEKRETIVLQEGRTESDE